jgi:hypothetical protein
MNYEVKRFLMDCGEEWRDTYLEYLPEEILQMIYKIIYECCWENIKVKSIIKYERKPKFPERKSQWIIPCNIDYIFPYGFVPQYKSTTSSKHSLDILPFTDSKYTSSFDGEHITYRAYQESSRAGQIQSFEYFDYLGVFFKQYRYRHSVNYERGSIKEGQLRYLFERDNYIICVRNINKINKKTKEIKFEIILNDCNFHYYMMNSQEMKTELLDRKQSVECMFDDEYGGHLGNGKKVKLFKSILQI